MSDIPENKNEDQQLSAQNQNHLDILSTEKDIIKGRKIGDKSVRFRKMHFKGIKKIEQGAYEITSDAEPKSFFSRVMSKLNLTLIGTPLKTKEEVHERLTKIKGLAVFAPDNISSSAYAPEEILRALILGGAGALLMNIPVAFAILILLAIVTFSYQQTIRAYPKGGGSYIVTKDNLGNLAGLVAASAILIDYTLTVAVSISAGVAAITSAFPILYNERVLLCLVAIAIVTIGNLRGIRESGNLFTIPVYYYIAVMFGIIGYGLFKHFTVGVPIYVAKAGVAHVTSSALGFFLILRAFSAGACGLTGVEAVADGVGAFKPPEGRNAGIAMIWMASLFGAIFFGVSFLAGKTGIIPDPAEVETVISQLTRTLIGTNWYYYVVQSAVAVILLVAANTSFADFPRLASFMARDKFLPSHFGFRGDRLAFNNGIIVLACLASVLVIMFKASVTLLIPLYTVGVFIAFTLSQAAMVKRRLRLRDKGWFTGAMISGSGAVICAVVMIVVGATKFTHGAWMVLVLIPILVLIFWNIYLHYKRISEIIMINVENKEDCAKELSENIVNHIIIPVSNITRPVLQAVAYANSLIGKEKHNTMIHAVHVTDNYEEGLAMQKKWTELHTGIPMYIIESPYRRLIRPLTHYINALEKRGKKQKTFITVLLPEVVSSAWWKHIYHTNVAFILKGVLFFRPNTVVISFPYHV